MAATPGPWTTLHGYVVTADPDGSVKLNSRIIVPLREQRDNGMFETSAEDAALICAAPDLAAALAACVREMSVASAKEFAYMPPALFMEALNSARRVLAKLETPNA